MRAASVRIALVICLALAASCGGSGQGGGVSGRAVLKGSPAAGAEVKVYDVPEKSDRPPVVSVRAGSDGRFFAPLKPGVYYVAVKLESPTGGPPFLSKVPPDPVKVGRADADVGDMALAPGEGRDKPPPGAGVKGVVVRDGDPAAGAVVYLYENTDSGLKGPSHYASERTGEDGSFSVDAVPGRYYVVVRRRSGESSAGELSPGDLSGECPLNPVAVKAKGYSDAGVIKLAVIDPARLDGLKIGIKEDRGRASISGRVADEAGAPISGVYVFAYGDYRMMGKPRLISEKTGPDGKYRLILDQAGKYYIGARNSLGGPMEPGDLVGVYDGSADNSVSVGPAGRIGKVDITLREVQ